MKYIIKSVSLIVLLHALTVNSFAQIGIGVEPIDKVVEAINGKNFQILKPYISEQTKVGAIPPAYTENVLSQLLAQIGNVEAVQLIKKEKEGENTRYVCSFKIGDKEREYNFLLTPQNKFLELNIVKAELKKINNQFKDAETKYPPSLEIPFRLVDKHILVQAEVDGKKGDFIFDSGSPSLFLNQAYFKTPDEKSITTGGAKGVSGSIGGLSYFKAQSFNWSGIGFKDKEITTMNIAHLEKGLNEKEILGLIGYSVIEKYAVTFDYKNKKLFLNLADSTVQNSEKPFFTAPIVLQGHLPIVELEVGGKTLRFAVDSGAGSNLIDKIYEAELMSALKNVEKDTLVGADNNPHQVTKGVLKKAVLKNKVDFKDMPTVFSDISHLNNGKNGKIDGILGFEFLRQYKTSLNFKGKSIEFYK
jgi:hypothetical protein